MSDTTNRLAGIANLTIDGVAVLLVADLKYRVASVARESMVGQDKWHGYSEKPVPGFISATLRDGQGFSWAQVNAMTNVTVVAELANGKTIVGRNMVTVGDGEEIETMEAKGEVRWEGASVIEA